MRLEMRRGGIQNLSGIDEIHGFPECEYCNISGTKPIYWSLRFSADDIDDKIFLDRNPDECECAKTGLYKLKHVAIVMNDKYIHNDINSDILEGVYRVACNREHQFYEGSITFTKVLQYVRYYMNSEGVIYE